MNIDYIEIPSGTRFLGDVMQNLPINCIFNKSVVGCGGTTIALQNSKDYIICVPFVALIDNKVASNEGVLGVTGNTTEEEVKGYMANPGIKKIMVTYDSLEKLINVVGVGFSLLIDEYHLLFTQYPFRKKAIQKVLDNYAKFDEYCFMTATVMDKEFILDELRDIRIVEAKWEEVEVIKVKPVKCLKGVSKTTIGLVYKFISGEFEGNAYFFVNSINFIKEIILNCRLTKEDTRIIWSDNNKKEISGFIRGKTTDSPKKINFLTSACFEGSDIFDPDGRTFIISDFRRSYTYLDISTSIRQIAGRIRDSRYKDTIHHIYTDNRFSSDLSFQDFEDQAKKEIEECKSHVETINGYPELHRAAIDVSRLNTRYIIKLKENILKFDSNLIKIDLFHFKLTNFLYTSSVHIHSEYKDNGFVVEPYTIDYDIEVVKLDDLEPSFKEVVNSIKENQYQNLAHGVPIDKAPYEKYEFLEKAIEIMGIEGIEAEGYNITNIRRKVNQHLGGSDHSRIFEVLNGYKKLKFGDFISLRQAKQLFTKVYADLGIPKTPIGGDLKHYFVLEEKVKQVNGTNMRGYEIIMPKVIFGNKEERGTFC